MKMNINSLFDHDEGHCTSLVKMGSYHHNKNEEDLNGYYKSIHTKIEKKYHTSYDKYQLLKAWYTAYCDAFKDDIDFYEDGVFVPPETLEEFINRNKHLSHNKLIRQCDYCDTYVSYNA